MSEELNKICDEGAKSFKIIADHKEFLENFAKVCGNLEHHLIHFGVENPEIRGQIIRGFIDNMKV